jgi:hypothetical protein
MKKAVVLGMILLALGTLVYAADAGVKITSFGRGLFAIEGGGDDTEATVTESWAANSARVGISILGTSDTAGFQIDIDTNTGAPEAGDQQKLWVKPFDMLTLQVGRIFDDTLRGSESFGAWNWLRYGSMSGDGAIFARVGEGGEVNFEAAVAPMDAVYLFAAVGGNGTDLYAGNQTAQNAFHGGQFGGAYTITGIGQVRAQYIGSPSGAHSSEVINAAFKVTAVPNLTADIGLFYAMKPDASPWDEKIAFGADYTAMEAMVLHAIGVFGLDKDNDMTMELGAGLDYTIDKAAGLGVNADLRYLNKAATALQDKDQIGFLLGIAKSFPNGEVGVGVEVQTSGYFAGVQPVSSDGSKMVWAIPVKVGVSF